MFAPTNTASMKTPNPFKSKEHHMPKIITRPQKLVTPVIESGTAITDQAHQLPTCSQAQAPLSLVASTALKIVEQVKLEAERAQDDEGISAHSLTLVELAARSLHQFSAAEVGLGHMASDLAYEAAALLAGALAWDVKDSPTSTKRHQLIEQAYQLMNAAAMSFGLESGPCASLAIGIEAGATAKAPKGYTAQQLHEALVLIAARASTLEQMLMEIEERCVGKVPASELATAVSAATIVANSIGGVADEVSGGDIVGNWATWTFGHNFAKAKEAVQS
jgi:hypothetical protein